MRSSSLSLCALALVSLLVVCVPAPAVAKDVSFIVIGDWGADPLEPATVETQKAVAAAMNVAAGATTPPVSFILNTGDNLYDAGLSSRSDPRWKSTFLDVFVTAAQPNLRALPWVSALGNHDYKGVVNHQLKRDDTPTWHMPARYFQWSLPDPSSDADAEVPLADVFVLDTNPMIEEYIKKPENSQMGKEIKSQNVTAQLAWLDKALSGSRARWKLVMGHHGAYASTAGHSHKEVQKLISPLLTKYGVAAYFNGHYHTMEHAVKANVHYWTSGAGSQVRLGISPSVARKLPKVVQPELKFAYRAPGFQVCTLGADSMTCKFVDVAQKELYSVTQTRPEAPAAAAESSKENKKKTKTEVATASTQRKDDGALQPSGKKGKK